MYICSLKLTFGIHSLSFSEEEIPKVSVPKASILQHGDDITIVCNLTEGKGFAPLKRVSWYKDGELLQTVRNPDLNSPQDSLGPLELKNIGVRAGGEYVCLLEVLLRGVKKYNVSDTTTIRSKFSYIHLSIHVSASKKLLWWHAWLKLNLGSVDFMYMYSPWLWGTGLLLPCILEA